LPLEALAVALLTVAPDQFGQPTRHRLGFSAWLTA
jgi:hypothetical protein